MQLYPLSWRVALSFLAVVTIAILAGAWFVLFPTPQFPAPIGPLGIGTRVYSWIDSSRAEPFTPNAGDHRAITVQIWFPTAAEGKVQRYIEQPAVLAAVAARLAAAKYKAGAGVEPADLLPVYLRLSEAEEKRLEAERRA